MDTFAKIRRMVLSAGVNEDEYSGILSEITESNRRNVLGLGILAFFFLTAMTLLSFIAPGLAVNRWLYVAHGQNIELRRCFKCCVSVAGTLISPLLIGPRMHTG